MHDAIAPHPRERNTAKQGRRYSLPDKLSEASGTHFHGLGFALSRVSRTAILAHFCIASKLLRRVTAQI
eukprot:5771466-Amphidinium_carterae.1